MLGRAKKQKTSSMAKIAVFLLMIPLLFMGMSSIIMLLVTMIPTILAMLVSGRTEPLKWMCVGAFNFAGLFPYLFDLWTQGNSLEVLVTILFNVQAFVTIYFFALLGLLFYILIPFLVDGILNIIISSRIARINKQQKSIVDLWGDGLISISKKVIANKKGAVDIYAEEEKMLADNEVSVEQAS